MSGLIKFEPLTVVETKDDIFFTTAPKSAVEAARKRNEPITINGTTLDPFEVKKIYTDEHGLASLTKEQYGRLVRRKKEFECNIGRKPSATEISRMLTKITHG